MSTREPRRPKRPVKEPAKPPPVKDPRPRTPPARDPRPEQPMRRDPPADPPDPGEPLPEIEDPPARGFPEPKRRLCVNRERVGSRGAGRGLSMNSEDPRTWR